MMRLFSSLLVVLVLQSCMTDKKMAELCKKCPGTVVIKDSIIERLVEVPVYIPPTPGPTVYVSSPCDSSGRLKPFKTEVKKNGIKTTVTANPKTNTLEIISNLEDSTKVVVPVKVKDTFHSEVKNINCSLTWWQTLWITSGKIAWGLIGILALFLGIRFWLKHA